jgi:hypothetical protein
MPNLLRPIREENLESAMVWYSFECLTVLPGFLENMETTQPSDETLTSKSWEVSAAEFNLHLCLDG